MPKLFTRRRRLGKKTHRRSKPTRRNHRKQRGGDLTANLAAKRDDAQGFVDNMAANQHGVSIHPNFPRKNDENKYVLIFKDIELEDDAAPQKLLVIKLEKQGADFVNVTVESLQDGVPQTYIENYPSQLDVLDADSIALSAALVAAFPEAGLGY
jgi:hypothetical protein